MAEKKATAKKATETKAAAAKKTTTVKKAAAPKAAAKEVLRRLLHVGYLSCSASTLYTDCSQGVC